MESNKLFCVVKKTPNQIVKEYLARNNLKQNFLSKQLNTTQGNLSKMLANKDLYVATLYEFSLALNFDFFAEMSKQLPPDIRNKSKNETVKLSELETAVIDLVKKNIK